jgi:hypothetical protein
MPPIPEISAIPISFDNVEPLEEHSQQTMLADSSLPSDLKEWNPADIGRFISSLGFPQYAELFVQSGISGEQFAALTTVDLKNTFKIQSLGDRKRIRSAIDQKLL